MNRNVVKVGGSLFRLPSFRSLLTHWLSTRSYESCLLIAGGGELADAIRQLSARFDLPEESSHWLAIRAMSVQAHVLAALLPNLPVTASLDDCRALWDRGNLHVIFDPIEIARSRDNLELPCDWSVTSDSIAARIARQSGADRLTLLKSVGGDRPFSLTEAVQWEWLDKHFPSLVGGMAIEWVNLREGKSCPLRDREQAQSFGGL